MGIIIGLILGLRVGGPWGALVGVILGHILLDRSGLAQKVYSFARALVGRPASDRYPPCPHCSQPMVAAAASVYTCLRCSGTLVGPLTRLGTKSAALHAATVGLLVSVSKSDGDLTSEEVKAIREFYARGLGLNPTQLAKIKELIKRTAAAPPQARSAAQALAQMTNREEREQLFEVCRKLAEVDGPPNPPERRTLHTIRQAFELDRENESEMDSDGEVRDPYEVLGLPRPSTPEKIQEAHRKLAGQYHPDRVAHLAPEFRELAERRFKQIQRAKEQLLG